MADVTADRTAARAAGGNGSGPVETGLPGARASVAPSGDGAGGIRVGLAPASRLAGDPTLVILPASAPADPDGSGVLAQRHGLVDGETQPAVLVSLGGDRHRVVVGAEATDIVLGPGHASARGVTVREVLVDGFRLEVEVEPERLASLRERATRGRASAAQAGPLEIRAIIPGRVLHVWVTTGDQVTAGERVLAIEAMKMQNELLAPRDGTIARVGIAVGETVEIGDLLVVIE